MTTCTAHPDPDSDFVDTEKSAKLFQKIALVSASIGIIEKEYAPGGGVSYKYQHFDTVFSALQNACIECRIWIAPGLESYKFEQVPDKFITVNGTQVQSIKAYLIVQGTVNVVDLETGHICSFQVAGQSNCIDDKSMQKAWTSAWKYGVLKYFMIPSTEFLDNDDDQEKPKAKPVSAKSEKVAAATNEQIVRQSKLESLKLLTPGSKEEQGKIYTSAKERSIARGTDVVDEWVKILEGMGVVIPE